MKNTTYIGETGKSNGCYKGFIASKLPKAAHTWSTSNSRVAFDLHTLCIEHLTFLKDGASNLPEELAKLKSFRDKQNKLKQEYSQLDDDDKNNMLLHCIDNYQEYKVYL